MTDDGFVTFLSLGGSFCFSRLTKTNPTPFPILPVYELLKPPAGSVSEAPDERLPSTCGGGLCSTVHVEAI